MDDDRLDQLWKGFLTRVLLLTGTCGSGKSTIAGLIGNRPGWFHLSEDAVWAQKFGRNRGAFGSAEHRQKRHDVQSIVFSDIRNHLAAGQSVALDATVHEAPPEAYEEYRAFFEANHVSWALRVLHPRLEIAVARDAARSAHAIGADRVADLRAKFTRAVFAPEWFVDTSTDTPGETVARLIADGVA
jgi:predicted kinase